MKIDLDLPLEVWVDSFKLLSRKQLAALLPHIGDEQEETENRPIADRQFVSFVQFYLHKCGDIKLVWVSIQPSSQGPVFVNNAGKELPLAEVPPMPLNIKSFGQININYYDESVLEFLQEFRPNFLLTNVNLTLYCENRPKFDAMSQMMTQLWPSITSIESLTPFCYDHNSALFQEDHSDMLASTRILLACHFGFGSSDDWYRHWLHIPREDGKPRVLLVTKVKTFENGISPLLPFIEKIKQVVSLFARILGRHSDANIHSISLDNDKTQEKLVIKADDPDLGHFVTIARYPVAATEEWLKEAWKIVDDVGWIYFQERQIVVNLNI